MNKINKAKGNERLHHQMSDQNLSFVVKFEDNSASLLVLLTFLSFYFHQIHGEINFPW